MTCRAHSAGGLSWRQVLPWLFLAFVFVLLAKVGADDLDSGVFGYLLPIAAVLVAVYAFTVLHEGGHLVAAYLLRLPVVSVRIRYRGQSFVQVRPAASARALPLRFILWHLAGPATDFAIAFVLFRYASEPMPVLVRDCVLAGALTAALLSLGSLLPHTYRTGVRSDGAQVARWLFHPSRQRAELTSAAAAATVDVAVMRKVADESITDADLDDFIGTTSDQRAKAVAVYLRFRRRLGLVADGPMTVSNVTIGPSVAADFAWLHRYALSPDAPDMVFDPLAPSLAAVAGLWQLHRLHVSGQPVDPAVATQIGELAEALARRRPSSPSAAVAAAIVDLLAGRPLPARDRLRGVSPPAAGDRARALLFRAVAEAALGDHAQADRTVAEAGEPGEGTPPVFADILTALRAVPTG